MVTFCANKTTASRGKSGIVVLLLRREKYCMDQELKSKAVRTYIHTFLCILNYFHPNAGATETQHAQYRLKRFKPSYILIFLFFLKSVCMVLVAIIPNHLTGRIEGTCLLVRKSACTHFYIKGLYACIGPDMQHIDWMLHWLTVTWSAGQQNKTPNRTRQTYLFQKFTSVQ